MTSDASSRSKKYFKISPAQSNRIFRSQGEGVCPLSSADILRTRGILQMRMSALFGAKHIEFFEIYGVSICPHGQGG